MNVVWWFTVVVIHGVLTEIKGFSVTSPANHQQFPPTRTNNSAASDGHQNHIWADAATSPTTNNESDNPSDISSTTIKKDSENKQNEITKDSREFSTSTSVHYSSKNVNKEIDSANKEMQTTDQNKISNDIQDTSSTEFSTSTSPDYLNTTVLLKASLPNANREIENYSTVSHINSDTVKTETESKDDLSSNTEELSSTKFSSNVTLNTRNMFTESLAEKFDESGSTSESTTTEEILSSSSTFSLHEERAEINCSAIPEVEFSFINASSFSISLEWEAPNNTVCVSEYVIYLNNEEYNRTTNLTFEIEDVHACTVYDIGIAVNNGNDTGAINPQTVNTTIPGNFTEYDVGTLQVNTGFNNTLNVTWEALPEEVFQCVTSYYLVWWNNNDTSEPTNAEDIEPSETSFELPLIGCFQYGIQIYPLAGEDKNGNLLQTTYSADALPTNAPEMITVEYGKNEARMSWQIDNQTQNRCPLNEIAVTCNAPSDQNEDYPWIIRYSEATEKISEPTPESIYEMLIGNLSAFTNYSCSCLVQNSGGNSTETQFHGTTEEDVPSEPAWIDITDISSDSFTIRWTEPTVIPGRMTSYGLSVNSDGPQHSPGETCVNNNTNHYFEVRNTSYIFGFATPYYKYTVSVFGIDGAGNGTEKTTDVITQSIEPEPVTNATRDDPVYSQNETYHGIVRVNFEPPCNTNGPFKFYRVSYSGKRTNFENDDGTYDTNATMADIEIWPERNYSINIVVVTENFTSAEVWVPSVQSEPGVPILAGNLKPPTSNDPARAHFTLSKSAFDDANGEVICYSLILFTSSVETGEGFGFWDGTNATWPTLPQNGRQLTPNFWNPFQGGVETWDFTIGTDGDCSGKDHCNQALNDDTKYWLLVRALTSAAYKDSSLLHFQTEMLDELNLGLILGLTFGLLALLVLVIFLIYLWRRKRKSEVPEEEKRSSTTAFTAIPVQRFSGHYINLKENYNVIKQQFSDLGVESKEAAGEITFATFPENRRKNRWTNILPFDATRVTLKIEEDDEISSDYINASYIKGYSGKVEYIATQGPLETTTRDFWKMILQENVSIIVMVSQFVEQSKEKCYQYFPNNHESFNFGENLEVRCSTELHFGTYCIRTLQVRKGREQRDVIHMQFLEWPDFGVPEGTDNMLQFCNQLREKIRKEGGLVVVHCSAGVGRTGTLIALDILLQTIDDHRDLNIYKTIFDLRTQRTNMVQTEKQYMFIHTCVKEYIESPTIQTHEVEEERIYENMNVLKSSLKKNLIETELESAL